MRQHIRVLGAFLTVAILAASLPAQAGLVARWSFDEAEGTTAEETVGGLDGTLEGDAQFAPGEGIRGGAVSLDAATDGVVNVGDHLEFTGMSSFSIQAWVKTTQTTGVIVVGRHVSTVVAGYWLGLNDTNDGSPNEADGSFHFYQSDNPQFNSGDLDVNDGQWHQIVAVRDGPANQLRLYLDGQRVPAPDSVGSLNSLVATPAPFIIGGLITGQAVDGVFTGLMDEVRVWNDPLDDADVAFFFEHPDALNKQLCGDANRSLTINATDSLFALRSAVGTSSCFLCICDANESGGITATDALIILKNAVGQDVALHCPVCAAGALDGLRWELPCTSSLGGNVCNCPNNFNYEATMLGEPGVTYDVTLRFRGVVEQKTYNGGEKDGLFHVGGTPAGDAFNIYRLSISDPPGTYYVNSGTSGIYQCYEVDITKTIPIAAGALVSMTGEAIDGHEIENTDGTGPIIPAGVPPAPQAYNGQFVQMDVVDVIEQE